MYWLQTNIAKIEYDGTTNFTLSHNLTAYGPGGGPTGVVSQDADLSFSLSFTGLAPGSYTCKLSDDYDLDYNLVQGAGAGYPFTLTHGFSILHLRGSWSGSTFWNDKVIIDEVKIGPDYSPVPDFSHSRDDAHQWVFTLDNVKEDDTITLSGEVFAVYHGYTVVPLPGTALLLGTGLVGLGLLGFRRMKRP